MQQKFHTRELIGSMNSIQEKNAPTNMYVDGDLSLLSAGQRVAIVGSRNASWEGLTRARAITKALVEHGIIVVSGLAEGIDTVAHETAIEMGGKTVAVLGTPLSEAYPISNKALLERIRRDHLAVSQFPEGYPLKRDNFPRRNRTMALICDATIVVEAAENSGTKHQGWEAIRLGRLVFIMKNVASDPKLSWPKEMIQYGAQVLSSEDMPDILYDIPSFTASSVSAF